MSEPLEAHDVRVIALSKDTVEEAATHKARDGLRLVLLADPQLEVIRKYGVEHHKALGFQTNKLAIGGIQLMLRPSFKTMAIPTTLLVDEHGIIRWIDQSDDYRIRSGEQRVLQAVRDAFE